MRTRALPPVACFVQTRSMAQESKVHALDVHDLTAGYGSLAVVHEVSLHVDHGEIVGLLGRNGAGKTTTLMAIAGFLGRYGGDVLVEGTPLVDRHTGAAERVSASSWRVEVFPFSLTVRQNLELAEADFSEALELFPELQSKLVLKAGLLSGGEQQMLALARAVCRHPVALLIDELSFGLAPALCERIFKRLRSIVAKTLTAVLLVEQHIHYAETVVDRP